LAILYREGRGIAAKDETKAKEYYEKAAELGQLHACYNLAMMLRQSLENSDDQ
jgi:TPR repeat protein